MNNKKKKLNPNDELYRAILTLKSTDECFRFFEDLCTVSELTAMQQRFEVAHMLDRGMIYNDILEKTGVSTATISRVNRSLNYGNDSYRTVFARMEAEENEA